MLEDKVIFAIFDFDGTLTEGHLWKGIAAHHKAKKIKRWSLFTYLARHIPLWLASKIKVYSEEKNRREWGEDLAVLFKGFSLKKTKEVFEWITIEYFMPLLRKDMLGLLKEHQKQGHKIVLLSGMFVEFLEIVGNKIGADYVQGTRLAFTDNVCSGTIIQPLCFGKGKVKLLQDLILNYQLNVDLKNSFAYADSYYDKYVFETVGNPIAVNPDTKLRVIAEREQWKIITSEPAAMI